ncbi:MAG: hypothetical protein M0R00_06300 [Candidatus Omnitrophica bacterium]|nr:hypothetical protein [Candidatus Omnitrophota bacterium]
MGFFYPFIEVMFRGDGRLKLNKNAKVCAHILTRKNVRKTLDIKYFFMYYVIMKQEKKCLFCDNVFTRIPNITGTKYCSRECYLKANAKQGREKKKSELYKKNQKEYYMKWYKEKGRKRASNYSEIITEWRLAHPIESDARIKVADAVRRGLLKKPSFCTICGENKKLNGHHEDYSEPLKVLWVCHSCHKKLHNTKRNSA